LDKISHAWPFADNSSLVNESSDIKKIIKTSVARLSALLDRSFDRRIFWGTNGSYSQDCTTSE